MANRTKTVFQGKDAIFQLLNFFRAAFSAGNAVGDGQKERALKQAGQRNYDHDDQSN